MEKNEINTLAQLLKGHMELEEMSGIREYALKAETAKIVETGDLGTLEKEVSACSSCDLCRTRTNVVFGSGSRTAKLMFIGEAPGFDEDREGMPFVGKAGQLLTKIIESIQLGRKDVFIANILKCRPPNNRNPLPTEVLACQGFLFRQINVIRPKIICALGKFAAQTLLGTETPITKLRGNFHDYNGIPVMPTFHPAYLLRNPEDKRLVWEDMKKIRDFLKTV